MFRKKSINVLSFNSAAMLSALVSAAVHAVPPANDNCSTATVISGTSFEQTIDISQATTQPCEAVSSCDAGSSQSVWYRMTAPADGRLWAHVLSESPFESYVVSVFDNCAASLFGGCIQPQEIGCGVSEPYYPGTQASAHVDVLANQTYLIKVALNQGFGIGAQVTIQFHPWVTNDECADATLIPPGGIDTSQDIILSQFNSCEVTLSTACLPWTFFVYVNAAWYRYDAVADGVLHVEAGGATLEQSIMAYDGCPFDAPPLGCVHPNELACILSAAPNEASLDLPSPPDNRTCFGLCRRTGIRRRRFLSPRHSPPPTTSAARRRSSVRPHSIQRRCRSG